MAKVNGKIVRYAIGTVALLVIAYFCRYASLSIEAGGMEASLLLTVLATVRNVIHISLLSAWCVSLQNRLVHKQIKRLMLGVGFMMVLWVLVRTVKWEFVVSWEEPLVRYLWYAFYIPMTLIPLLGVYIVHLIGKPEGYKLPKKFYLLFIPAFALITLIFTNDYHRLVFSFPSGIRLFNEDYTYGFLYAVVCGWYIVLGLYFVVKLLVKNRVPGSKAFKSLPLLIMIFSIGFWTLYALGIINSDLTTVDCLMITLLLESAIQSGLIPSNSNYNEIFDSTTVPVMVVDKNYDACYVSKSVSKLTREDMQKAEKDAVSIGNTLLHSSSINAGRVLWQDDVTVFNELKEQLQDTVSQLDEENDLLQAEIEIKENRAKADEKNRLYDRIAQEVEPQLIKIDKLLDDIDGNSENTPQLISKVCVIGSYIKRRGNLLLLAEENPVIDTKELEYCIRESLDNLALGGVFTSLYSNCEGALKIDYIVAVYDFYEDLTERLLENITAMMIHLNCESDIVKMNIQIGCREDIVKQVLSGMTLAFGSFNYEIEDEDVIIKLTIGGESND